MIYICYALVTNEIKEIRHFLEMLILKVVYVILDLIAQKRSPRRVLLGLIFCLYFITTYHYLITCYQIHVIFLLALHVTIIQAGSQSCVFKGLPFSK